MADAFECPKCGAPLNFTPEDLEGKETIACPYCGDSVIIPPDMRARSEAKIALANELVTIRELTRQVESDPTVVSYETTPLAPPPQPVKGTRRSITGCVVVAVILAVAIAAIGFFAVLALGKSALKSANGIIAEMTNTPAHIPPTLAAPVIPPGSRATVDLADLETPTEVPTITDTPTPEVNTTATAETEATRLAQNALVQQQQNWPVVIQEKFANDARNWTTGKDNSDLAIEESSISGNKYTWKITTKKSMGSFTFPDMADQADLYVSVDLQMTTTSDNTEDQSGIIFHRSTTDKSFYFFGVNPAGTYSLTMYDGSQWSDMIPTAETTALKPGQVNHIAVSMQDNLILLVINNTLVDSFEDSQISSGGAGLGLNLPSPGEEATVIFSNFYVRAPKK